MRILGLPNFYTETSWTRRCPEWSDWDCGHRRRRIDGIQHHLAYRHQYSLRSEQTSMETLTLVDASPKETDALARCYGIWMDPCIS